MGYTGHEIKSLALEIRSVSYLSRQLVHLHCSVRLCLFCFNQSYYCTKTNWETTHAWMPWSQSAGLQYQFVCRQQNNCCSMKQGFQTS